MPKKRNWMAQRPASPRDELAWFARLMEARLRDNDHKGGWSHEGSDYLLERMDLEVAEVSAAVSHASAQEPSLKNRFAIIEECADLANFAMMLADVTMDSIEESLNDEAEV